MSEPHENADGREMRYRLRRLEDEYGRMAELLAHVAEELFPADGLTLTDRVYKLEHARNDNE